MIWRPLLRRLPRERNPGKHIVAALPRRKNLFVRTSRGPVRALPWQRSGASRDGTGKLRGKTMRAPWRGAGFLGAPALALLFCLGGSPAYAEDALLAPRVGAAAAASYLPGEARPSFM